MLFVHICPILRVCWTITWVLVPSWSFSVNVSAMSARMVVSRRDLKEFMDSCQHMTDRRFQRTSSTPLFQINRRFFRATRNLTGEVTSQWTWIGCPHVSKEGELKSLYTGCDPVFFYEGFVTCRDCIQIVPTASLYPQTLLECEAMTDDQLQDRVIDQLYPINRTAMGSCQALQPVSPTRPPSDNKV